MKQQNTTISSNMYAGNITKEVIGTSIILNQFDFTFQRKCTLATKHASKEILQMGFCFEGEQSWRYPELASKEMCITENESCLQYGSIDSSVSVFSENQYCKGINIILERERFASLISCFDCNAAITDLHNDTNQKSYPISPRVYLIANQIANCNICEGLRQIYLEGKVLELLSIYFDETICQRDVSENKKGISNEDYVCLLKAKEIIDKQYAHSITIVSLSRKVCLNEYKLKYGFKHCFGFTVLEYIIKRRMEMAEILLSHGNYKVKDVAWMVGYAKPSHFIDSFKKTYGITPGEVSKVSDS